MTLYELTEAMRFFDLEIDEETGEIMNGDELDLLQMDFDQKLKNCVYWYKNQKAEADALKAEKMKLAKRQQTAERKVEWMKRYIAECLGEGKKFAPEDDVTVRISWRKSKTVECEDVFQVPDEYLRYKEPELDKKRVTDALKAGEVVPGCELVEKQNIQIK